MNFSEATAAEHAANFAHRRYDDAGETIEPPPEYFGTLRTWLDAFDRDTVPQAAKAIDNLRQTLDRIMSNHVFFDPVNHRPFAGASKPFGPTVILGSISGTELAQLWAARDAASAAVATLVAKYQDDTPTLLEKDFRL